MPIATRRGCRAEWTWCTDRSKAHAASRGAGRRAHAACERCFWRGFECRSEARCWRPVSACSAPSARARAADDGGPSAKCLVCHGGDHEKMARSKHAVAADGRTFGCVGCHGSSSEHAENPTEKKPDQVFRGKSAMDASEASQACLACHTTATPKKMLLWAGSTHPESGVACTNCHTIHVNRDKVFNKAEQPTVCFACHKDVARAGEPAVASSDPGRQGDLLGLPLGARLGRAEARQARHRQHTCYLCHAEKRGPVRAQPRAGPGELRDLPQPARQQHRGHARSRATRSSATSATRRIRPAASARCAGSRACCRRRCRRRRCRP